MTSQTQDLVITNTSSIPESNVISFGYIKKEDVKVEVGTTVSNRTLISSSDWTITSDRRVQLASSLFSATGTYKLKIYRQTDTSSLAHTFQVGSSIKAEDLNNSNKQAIFAAEENTNSINSLAAGDGSSALQIDGSNIADNSINSDKIINLQVKDVDLSSSATTDSERAVTTNHIRDNAVTTAKIPDDNVTANKLKSSSSTDSDRAVTTNHIRDGAVTDAKINSVSGSKVTPNFGSQNISTTGTLNAGTTTTGTTENTRLHIANENDADDDIYLQAGLVHTSGNFSVNGTCTASSFSGDGSGLSGLANIRQMQEATSISESSTDSSSFQNKVTYPVSTASNTRVLVFFGFDHEHSDDDNNHSVTTQLVATNGSFVFGNPSFSNKGDYVRVEGRRLDIGSHSGTRTYSLQFRSTNSDSRIKNAYITTIAFNV